jgi:CDP-4-dehydro-6-deoxyglucose reductase
MTDAVTLIPEGIRLTVAADESILDAALGAGINLPHSCKGGACGSCRARLLEGQVNYPFRPPLALSEREAAEGFALLCQARPAGEVRIEARRIATPAQIRIKRLPCRVETIEPLSHDVMQIILRLPAVEPLDFLPGQYIDILLDGGRRRSFSIASAPSGSQFLELHVRRVPGGGFTAKVFEQLAPRALLTIEGPLGGFYLREEDGRPRVFLAGGTGLAPLASMLRWSFEHGDTTPARLYWGVRERRDLYWHEQLLRWSEAHAHLSYTPVLSEPAPGDRWRGRTGLVHEAMLADAANLKDASVYLAGPPAMVEAGRRAAAELELPPERVFFDSFDFAPDAQRAMDRRRGA